MSNGRLENRLREMLLREEIAPGDRITEAALAARLGVSRTPIRNILPRLAAEGLIRPTGRRGYVAAEFSSNEIFGALDLRALLEGWAARLLAEKGADEKILEVLERCLENGDKILSKGVILEDDAESYGEMNAIFHQTIVENSDSIMIKKFVDILNGMPFISPSFIVFDDIGRKSAFNLLHRAHGFHHAIVDAIRSRDGSRVEFLFREHANQQRLSMFEQKRSNEAKTRTV